MPEPVPDHDMHPTGRPTLDPVAGIGRLDARVAWAAAFERRIVAREHDLVAAVRTDIHKADWETVTQDILPLVASIRWHRDHAARVLGPRKLGGAPWWMLGQRHWAQRLPLGRVLVIATWNYPLQLLGIQLTQSVVAGNRTVVKPSERAPRSQRMLVELAREALADAGLPADMVRAADATREAGRELLERERFDHVVFTGSTAVGRKVAGQVAQRFGRTILELGGNNALAIMDDADLDLALPAVLFGSVGTAGQRCTTTRRLLVHEKIADEVERRLVRAYGGIRIGDPCADGTLCGPLVTPEAVAEMQSALAWSKALGGTVLYGGEKLTLPGNLAGGNFVRPAIVRAQNEWPIVQEETFAPILYVIRVKDLDDAIAKNNGVPQGLSSAIFTRDVRSAERWIAATGSDCGIANVNIGTSGAEIGGAFGGEKDTGGGREAGSDSWKAYMRRQTNTVNYSDKLPLAQGIQFG